MITSTRPSRRLQRLLAVLVASVVASATLALAGGSSASATSTASAVSTSKLGACKQKAASACRKVTARKCRASVTKRLRAQDKRVNQRKIKASCARKARRHCAKRSEKRKQARVAVRCVRKHTRTINSRAAANVVRPGVRPGPANTGVPSGVRLKVHRGDLVITQDGAVVSGLDVRGFVWVKGSNVTIKNSIIRGGQTGTVNRALLATHGGQTGLRIVDTTLKGAYPTPWLDGIKGGSFVAERVDISNVVDNAVVFGKDAIIRDSWLHGNTHFTPDPRQPDNKSHDDNVQIEGGTNFVVEDNTIEGSNNAAIMVTQNWARTAGVRVSGNHLQDGGCTINLSEKGKGGPLSDVAITSNTFGNSRHYANRCPIRVPRTSDVRLASNVFSTSGAANPVMF